MGTDLRDRRGAAAGAARIPRDLQYDLAGRAPRLPHANPISPEATSNRRHRGVGFNPVSQKPRAVQQGARTDLASIEAMSQAEAVELLNVSRITPPGTFRYKGLKLHAGCKGGGGKRGGPIGGDTPWPGRRKRHPLQPVEQAPRGQARSPASALP